MQDARAARATMVHLRVRAGEAGADTLVYTLRSLREAAEMYDFLREFFPDAEFVVQPALH